MELRGGKLWQLGFGFLHADKIGVLALQPIEKAFPRGGSNAIGVQRNDPHAWGTPRGESERRPE
jgi:hypothetical protein